MRTANDTHATHLTRRIGGRLCNFDHLGRWDNPRRDGCTGCNAEREHDHSDNQLCRMAENWASVVIVGCRRSFDHEKSSYRPPPWAWRPHRGHNRAAFRPTCGGCACAQSRTRGPARRSVLTLKRLVGCDTRRSRLSEDRRPRLSGQGLSRHRRDLSSRGFGSSSICPRAA